MDKRRTDLDLLRVILAVLVVLGHGSFYTLETAFGGVDYSRLIAGETVFHEVVTRLSDWIYTFHMPAYFCLSGAVFSLELSRGKYPSLGPLAAAKARRLLVPLGFVWLAWNIPLKGLSGYYAGEAHPLGAAFIQIFFPEGVYLWFLEALFLVFLLDYLLVTRVRGPVRQFGLAALAFLVGLAFWRYFRPWTPAGNPLKYLIWFWFGHRIDSVVQSLRKTFGQGLLFLETALFLVAWAVVERMPWGGWLLEATLLPLLGTLWAWELADRLARCPGVGERARRWAGYTFGLYLWADPLNYLVLYGAWRLCGPAFFEAEMGAAALYALRVAGSALVAVAITARLRKSKFPLRVY